MKICFINTLRLGDSIMSFHVIHSLIKKYPLAEIDYVCFDESKPLKDIINCEVNFHIIERKLIQKQASDLSCGFFRPFEELEHNLQAVWSKEYDLCINFSNTRLSTYICSALMAKVKIGSNYNEQGILNYGSKWIEYLDKITSKNTGIFHINEIFLNALNLDEVKATLFKSTKRASIETSKIINTASPYVVLQFLSSDKKKDLSFEQANHLISNLQKEGIRVCIPCTIQEKDLLLQQVRGADIVACSLDGLQKLLEHAELIVSVDTSVKQLASFVQRPLVEISLGSSKAVQTGPFKEDSFVIVPKVDCYPCAHSQACNNNFICSSRLNIDELSLAIVQIYTNRNIDTAQSFDIKSVLKEESFYFLISEEVSQSKDLLNKLSLYKYYLADTKRSSSVVYKVHRRFDLLRLKEKLLTLERTKDSIDSLQDYVQLGKPVQNFILSRHYQDLEENLSSLSFPSEFLSLKQMPANKNFDFQLVRQARNFLTDSKKYINSMRLLILDIETEGNYAQR